MQETEHAQVTDFMFNVQQIHGNEEFSVTPEDTQLEDVQDDHVSVLTGLLDTGRG